MKTQKMTNAYKNAVGTVFLLFGAFCICSTLLSMRTVLADPIAPVQSGTNATTATGRVNSARASARNVSNARGTAARSTVARTTNATRATNASRTTIPGASRSNASTAQRSIRTRSVSVRNTNSASQNTQTPVRANTGNRSISTRGNANNTTMRGIAASRNGRVVARSTKPSSSRVSLVGSGMRYSTGAGVNVSYLTNKLYTGNYSNIIDSTTGLISADAYSACLESYYTCMDEICTARSDAKGRCSCAGRAKNFLAAETALEKANEELIQLSGQLALLISTKGKDVSEAFKLTDAEKVMNCVSYRENVSTGKQTEAAWYEEHPTWKNDANNSAMQTSGIPYYCNSCEGNNRTNCNNFGFDIKNIDGSGSDILASLRAWADAKDLAKQFKENDPDDFIAQYTTIGGVVNGLSGITETVDTSQAQLDGLANKWGYELFEYAHNNVCGRVLDSCFNGIYEACGTPPSGNDSAGHKIGKCANGASGNCPYNYNSAISVTVKGDGSGEVALNERGATGSTTSTSASCFGYTSTSGDPYATLRGPVADARRSIMQKYLLDSNAACDTYGDALKSTAQNINYQKIAAEQALRQKRMDFHNEEEAKIEADAITAFANFNECISEIWDCYNENADEENWTTARIKTYCAQVANVPHCYEPMICKPSRAQFNAIIDVADSDDCIYSVNRDENTCRNLVTLQEILYRATSKLNPDLLSRNENTGLDILDTILQGESDMSKDSAIIREACLLKALNCDPQHPDEQDCLRNFDKTKYKNKNNTSGD